MEQIQLETVVQSDGTLFLKDLPFKSGETVEVTIRTTQSTSRGPFGLCAGEFTVPAEFDEPLPEDVLRDFEAA